MRKANISEANQKWEKRTAEYYKAVYVKITEQQKLFQSGFHGTLIISCLVCSVVFIFMFLNEMGFVGVLASIVMMFLGLGMGLNSASVSLKKILGETPKE